MPGATALSEDGWDVVTLLDEIDGIGRDPSRGGWSRHVFDDAELQLRDWFLTKAVLLGLTVEVDRNANLWAWWGAPARPGDNAIAVGSHLDSVPGGGAYDGPLGVTSALAAFARLRAEGFEPTVPMAVVVFMEEEGSRFGLACLGSKLMSGAIDPERVAALMDSGGATLAEVARSNGVDPDDLGRDDDRIAALAAFVELHVEQGRGLADLGAPIAVASSILAHGRWRLSFGGEGNHAGTTAMADRRDPVAAFGTAVLAAQRAATVRDDPGRGAHSRATIGRMVAVPGGTNVIARRVDAWLDVRADGDVEARSLVDEIVATAHEGAAAHGCTLEVAAESYGSRVDFDPALRERIAGLLGGAPLLATGAGHDAGVLSDVLPTAMVFVRNPTGVSHAPSESSSDEDCRAGVAALVTVVRDLAS
ncbi:allantoate amidohydrolase [Gryllotalpicola sp.]|uniref:allantoate amidohydrolase n=1 Tax=Gryllotalpicola sp. TaxID=1932787 RepID=UPI0026362E95|nr:allantoate amidohydrolase [Gryllotalpicola sp.]